MSELAPYLNQIYHGDAFEFAAQLPASSIDCVVTSPPYFGLRSYLDMEHPDKSHEVGSEDSPQAYVARLVSLFDLIYKALKPSGSVFLNLGDSYSSNSQHAISCDTCGKGQSNYPSHDYLFESLCGGCLSDLVSRRFRICGLLDPKQSPLPSASTHASKEFGSAHPPTLNYFDQENRISTSIQGQEHLTNLGGVQLPAFQESKTDGFSQQHQDLLTQTDMISSDQLAIDSSSGGVHSFYRKEYGESLPDDCNSDSVSLFEGQQRRNQYTCGCCSLCGSYSDNLHTNIKAYCTTCEYKKPLPPKNLLMIPARVAIALQDSGWILRSEIIWHKPAPMPESVKDRPTKAHEVIYLLTKSPRYWYDQSANTNGLMDSSKSRLQYGWNGNQSRDYPTGQQNHISNYYDKEVDASKGANLRDVWTLPEQKLRLRDDISPEQRSHVISELLKRGLL